MQHYGPLLQTLRKYWRVILAGGFVAAALAFLITSIVTPTYQAEAVVAIAKSSIQVNFDPRFKTSSDSDFAQTALDQTARRRALAAIAESPSLANNVVQKLGDRLKPAQQNPVKLGRDISASADGDLIRIRAIDSDPDQAALLANAWAQEYENRVNEIYGDPALSINNVEAQASTLKQDYDQKEAALVAYLRDNATAQLTRALQEKQQKLADNFTLSNKYDRLLADAQALRQRLASGQNTNTLADQLASLLLEVNAFNTASSLPLGGQSPGDVLPSNLQLRIDQFSANAPTTELLGNLDTLLAAIEDRRKLVQSDAIAQLQQEVNQLQAQLEQENARRQGLTQERDLAWTSYTALANKAAEINVSAQAKSTVVKLAAPAIVPLDPIQPKKGVYTGLAAILGLLATAILAVLIEAYAPSERTLPQLNHPLETDNVIGKLHSRD